MKKATIALFVSSMMVAAFVCSACNKDADLSTNGTNSKTSDPTKLANQGLNGVKAKNGGGMAPDPEPAKPGEKTGIPK